MRRIYVFTGDSILFIVTVQASIIINMINLLTYFAGKCKINAERTSHRWKSMKYHLVTHSSDKHWMPSHAFSIPLCFVFLTIPFVVLDRFGIFSKHIYLSSVPWKMIEIFIINSQFCNTVLCCLCWIGKILSQCKLFRCTLKLMHVKQLSHAIFVRKRHLSKSI